MRDGWQRKTLGEVLQKTLTSSPRESPDAEFDYIDVSSVSNTTFHIEATQRLKGRDAPSRARRLVKANDVLFATVRPTLQRIAVVPERLDGQVCSTGYVVLRPMAGLHHRFLFHFLFTADFRTSMEGLQKGASYPAVTDSEVKSQSIPVPPLSEQQRIVGILDDALEGVAAARKTAERNIRNARALFESYLDSVFSRRDEGWAERHLGQAVDATCTLSYGIVQPGEECPNGLPVIRPMDLTTKTISAGGLKRIDPKRADSYQRTRLQGGELLLCVRGSTGVVSVASTELAGANVTRGIVPVRFDSAVIGQEFGYYLLRSGGVQRQVREKTYGAALMQINIRDVRGIRVWYPSLKKQTALVARLDEVSAIAERLEANSQHKLAALDELKKSLLHQAFSGQL